MRRARALTGVWVLARRIVKRKEKEKQPKRKSSTHGNPGRNKIDLVQHVDQLFVRLFLPQELDDGFTPGSHRIPGIEDVDDNVGRVENLVQFSPDSTRGSFGVDRFGHEGSDGVEGSEGLDVGFRVGNCVQTER